MKAPQLTLATLLLALWAAVNASWLAQDRLVQDGDEMGHVGAAELFMEDLAQGQPGAFLARSVSAEMGDYPPAYPASAGLFWWASGVVDPGRASFRATGLIWLLALGLGVTGICREVGRSLPTALLSGALALWLPLPMALGKHFMPEVMLAAACTWALWAALRQRADPSPGRALVLGVSIGVALLVKQSALLFVVLPTLGLVRWRPSLAWALLGLAVALPWYANNLGAQGGYLWGSATHSGGGDWLDHLLFYPRALWAPVLGPVALLLGAGGAFATWQERGLSLRLALLWSLGLLPLLVLPNKYERLLLPLLPLLPVLVASLLSRWPKTAWALPALPAWSAALSFGALPALAQAPQANTAFQEGCPQSWLRAPVTSSSGLAEAVAAIRGAEPGPVLVRHGPSFPCALQTTHPWAAHLEIALRRDGQDRAVRGDGFGVVILDFRPGTPGTPMDIPQLETAYTLQRLRRSPAGASGGSLGPLEPK